MLAELAEQPGGLGSLADLPEPVVRELKELGLYDLFAEAPPKPQATTQQAADLPQGASKEALA
ncbi:hypothetical protein D3C78_1767370 [compost metagenome]